MLLGYAVGCSDAYDSIEPYDEIGGLDAALIGPLVALLDALEVAHQELTRPASPQEWGSRLHDLMQLFRSEEHTSELQPLMRISYAVFCLKKKKQNDAKRT